MKNQTILCAYVSHKRIPAVLTCLLLFCFAFLFAYIQLALATTTLDRSYDDIPADELSISNKTAEVEWFGVAGSVVDKSLLVP